MSVINSVLKDLDNRPSAFTPLTTESMPAASRIGPRQLVNPLLLIALAALVVAYVYAYWLDKSVNGVVDSPLRWTPSTEVKSSPIQPHGEVINPDSAPVAADSIIVSASNAIVGLQINEDQQGMTLEFELDQAARSFLKQRSNNRYVFAMREVSSEISVPYVSDNPWLSQITIGSAGTDVEIRFDTQPGVLVESSDTSRNGRYLWSIRLKKTIVAPATSPTEKIQQPQVAISTSDRSASKSLEAAAAAPEPVTTNDTVTKPANSAPVKVQIRPVKAPLNNEQRLSLAIKETQAGNLAAARKRLVELLDSPLDHSARVHLLELLRASGDGAEFQRILQTGLKRYPEDEIFALHQANQLFAAQKYQDLIDQLGSIESPSAAMQTLLAASYQRLSQHREAAQYYIEALKQDPRQPRNWISLGISQQHLGDREQALHAFRMAPRSGSLNQRLHEFVQARIQQLSNPD